MRAVPLRDGPVQIVNALDLDQRANGFVPRRLPAWTRHQITDVSMDVTVQMPGTIRLRLDTDAQRIELDVHLTHIRGADEDLRPASFDLVDEAGHVARTVTSAGHQIVLNGPDPTDVTFIPGEATRITFDGLEGTHTYELWLSHRVIVELRELRVASTALVEATVADPRPRWVHYGSSISQCHEVDGPTETWPVIAARQGAVSVTNLGFGGNCMLDPFVARTIRDLDVDAISLCIGINILGGDTMRERTFAPAVHGFLDTIRERHPDTPIVVISPIFCPSAEDRPGPHVFGPDGKFDTIEGCDEIRGGALTLRRIREILTTVVDTRRSVGDANLHILDGLTLLGSDEAADLGDDLHPNSAGYARMARRFAAYAFGPEGPFETRPRSAGRTGSA